MKFHEFIGKVQHRARLADEEQAVRAARITLETLAERLAGGMAENLAAQLPREVGRWLTANGRQGESERFGLDEFFHRVSVREGVDPPDAVHHARAVLDVLRDAVGDGEMQKVRAQLPPEYDRVLLSGSEGKMPGA